jgi:lipopolysaccharide heptosyltransferase II
MALPMINDVHEVYDDVVVTVMVPEYLAELFEQNPSIERLIRIPAEHVHGLIAVKKGVDLMHGCHYNIGYVLPPSFGSAAVFKLSGVDERVGYIADGRRLLLSRPMPQPAPVDSVHRSELYFNLLRRATGIELDYTKPKLFISEEESKRATETLDGFGVAQDQPFIVIASRAVAESRRWGESNYGRLAAELIKAQDVAVVLVGTAEESESANQVITVAVETGINPKRLVNLCGKTKLRESGAVISNARLFIGNDSGAAHLAAAVGTPLVVLSGADNPKETSPQANVKRLIYKVELECISCVKNSCHLKGDETMQCMKKITVAEVQSAAQELLS